MYHYLIRHLFLYSLARKLELLAYRAHLEARPPLDIWGQEPFGPHLRILKQPPLGSYFCVYSSQPLHSLTHFKIYPML